MPRLFDPIDIKGMRLANRIVMPPMAIDKATDDGEVTDRHLRHYGARARAGTGLLIVEHTYVMRGGRLSKGQLGLDDDRLVSGLRRLADTIHQHGARVALQLTHCGGRGTEVVLGSRPVGPSEVAVPGSSEIPRSLTVREIEEIVRAFGAAARRAAVAGVDAVELHGAHGFLLSEFLSPYTNRRTDEYGGDEECRLRLPLEVIAEVRRAVDFPLLYRLGADDMVPGGLTPEDARRIASRLEAAGVDVIDVSGGLAGSGRDRFAEQGFFIPLAQHIKEVVHIPVIGIGNIRDPEFADAVIREGKVDLVAIGRAMLADPEWSLKAAQQLSVVGG